MKLKQKISSLSIRAKLNLLVGMICGTFFVIFCSTLFVGNSLRGKFLNVTDSNMTSLIVNSHITREFSILVTGVDLLSNTFQGRDDFLKSKGENVVAHATEIISKTTDPTLRSSIVKVRKRLDFFIKQGFIVNKVLYDLKNTGIEIHNNITKLEDIISELLLQYTLAGKDTSFIEQQLALSIGYRESVLKIEKLNAALGYVHYSRNFEDHSSPILTALEDLLLRLQSVSASIPVIVHKGQQISQSVQRYKETISKLNLVFVELTKNKVALRQSMDLSSLVMKIIEDRISESTFHIRKGIEEIVYVASLSIFLISLMVIALLIVSTKSLFTFCINRPMGVVLNSIKLFKQGKLDSKICLHREDEWDAIEKALNEMATDLLQSYTALEKSELRFRGLAELLPQIVFETDRYGKIIFFNDVGNHMTGYSKDDHVEGFNVLDFLVSDDRKRAGTIFNSLMQGGEVTSGNEYRLLTKDGQHIPVLAYTNPIVIEGQIVGLRGIVVDISERKKHEDIIRENEYFLNAIIENIPNMIFIKNAHDLSFVRLNSAVEKLTGYSREDLIGKSDHDFFPKEEADFFASKDRDVLKSKQMIDIPEEYIETESKGRRVLHTQKIPLLMTDGEPEYILGISEDITEGKQAEKKLKQYAETQAILLREVNHRVTNNLTAIISMFHMAEDCAREQQMTVERKLLQEIAGRINGLLAVHSLLSSTGWQPLSLQTLCEIIIHESLKEASLETRQNNIEISGADINVHCDQAHQLTLVLNELAINTIKHAPSGNHNITVHINISMQSDSVCLLYRDNGAGFPDSILADEIPKSCMGLNLIRGIVECTLQGKFKVFNDNGAQTSIIFRPMEDEQPVSGEI